MSLPDEVDFQRCFEILKRSDFSGTIALIYDGPSDDEWRYLDDALVIARSAFPIESPEDVIPREPWRPRNLEFENVRG